MNTAGGIQETRLFTERGIIEVAFLAGTAKAEKFRDDIYDLLVSLREKNMVSFGANGLDVKLIEEVKEECEKTTEVIEQKEKDTKALEEWLKDSFMLFAQDMELYKQDREAIHYVKCFEERLIGVEIDTIQMKNIIKTLITENKTLANELKKINKKLVGNL